MRPPVGVGGIILRSPIVPRQSAVDPVDPLVSSPFRAHIEETCNFRDQRGSIMLVPRGIGKYVHDDHCNFDDNYVIDTKPTGRSWPWRPYGPLRKVFLGRLSLDRQSLARSHLRDGVGILVPFGAGSERIGNTSQVSTSAEK